MMTEIRMRKLRERYGRLRPWSERGMVPVILGFVWTCVGFSYLFDPWPAKTQHTMFLPLSIMPQDRWGCVFIFCGILAAISSRWPPHQDTWGFVVLGSSAMWWGVCFLFGAVVNDGRAFSGAAVWLALCVLLFFLNRVLPAKRGE